MDLKVLLGFLFCATVVFAGHESADSQTTAEDDSDMYMEPLEDDHRPDASTNHDNAHAESGNWFPSFSRSYDHPPSGHSRPVFYNSYSQQEGAYSQRNDPPFQQDVNFNEQPKYSGFNSYQEEKQQQPANNDKSASLLGDGNFGVITGGTFFPEKDGYDSESSSGFDDFSSFFHNGHGRPSYFYPSNPKPGKQQQFENFRDFADINSPSERQYSQYVVVYTNKNGTRTTITPSKDIEAKEPTLDETQHVRIDAKRPKNILESLALLDRAEAPSSDTKLDNMMILTRTLLLPSYDQGDIIEIPPEKKLSKSKIKLAKLLPEKKHEARLVQKAKDMKEPLLALS